MSSQLIQAVCRVFATSPIGMGIILTVYFDGIILRPVAESLMKRQLPWIVLAVCLACGCGRGGAMEIPTVELGGDGGARLMNGTAKTPSEAYENAYSQLTRAHYNVRRNLDGRSQNQYGAREAMKQIVGCLETMRGCVPPAGRPPFEPYLGRYAGWVKELDNGRSEEHTSELQSHSDLVCRLLL